MATTHQRELELVLALDHVRDSFEDDDDPQLMFNGIVSLLKSQFEADACALTLVAETSDDIECIAAVGMSDAAARELCQEAMKLESPAPIQTSRWPHTLGIRIFLGSYPLGGLVLARAKQSFGDDEMTLLTTAESQVDSAIIQARMVWKLLHRNRELEAIYQIDRLRDHTSNENDLISGFTTVLLEHFNAAVCIVMLTHIDSGELAIRGIVDKHDLPAAALDAIANTVREIKIPQVIATPEGVKDLTFLAAPFIVSGVRLGASVVARKKPFTVADHRLLHAMISQMDSAMVYSRIFQQLTLRNRELETIYRIDRIRDKEQDFDAMLQSVLTGLCDAVSSEMGYIMLYNQQRELELEVRSYTSDGMVNSSDYYETIQDFSRRTLKEGKLIFDNEAQGQLRSIIAVPLILNERIIGVFGAVNSTNPRGFNAEDRRILSAITSQVDTAVFERLEQRQLRKVLTRSVDPKIIEQMLQKTDANILSGSSVVISTLFADLRGSTEWAERVKPEELVATINLFLGRMTEVIFKHGGTLDKFVGDQVIGLFGTPVPMDNHARSATAAAMEMQVVHKALQEELQAQGRELPDMGIGVSTGEAIAGEFGASNYTEFTAMGRIVNLGARICSAAEGAQVLISQPTYEMTQDFVTVNPLEPLVLKGISQPVPVYDVRSVFGD